jgi:hypothetical protein
MKAINKTKVITLALASFFIMGSSESVLAYDNGKSPIEFTLVGRVNQSPQFQFKANNTEVGEYQVKVKDADGNILFSEILKGVNVWRNYRIDLTEADLTDAFKVRFEVTNLKTKDSYIYNATRSSRVVEDIIVAKL